MSKPVNGEPSDQPAASGWDDFTHFLRHEKKWWLGPIVAVLVLVALLIMYTRGRGLAPFMYNIF